MFNTLLRLLGVGSADHRILFAEKRYPPLVKFKARLDRAPTGSVLFLDIDGVLHPGNSETFSRMALLVSLLQLEPTASIVISSSWRKSCDYDHLKSYFPKGIRDRVIGHTGEVAGELSRHREICEFVGRFNVRAFVAIDDDDSLFPSHCHYLIKTDPAIGLTDAVVARTLRAITRVLDMQLSAIAPNLRRT